MKKLLMLTAAVAMLASCSQDLTSDLDLNVNGTENNSSWSGEGILIEASAEMVLSAILLGRLAMSLLWFTMALHISM